MEGGEEIEVSRENIAHSTELKSKFNPNLSLTTALDDSS